MTDFFWTHRHNQKKEAKMTLKPISDRVILKPIKEEKIGHIYIPDIMHPFYKEEGKTVFGTVMAVGHKVKQIKVNDLVFYSAFCGVPFIEDDIEYLIMKEEDIIAVETKDEA